VPDTTPILAFDSVTTAVDDWFDTPLDHFDLAVNPGELALFRFDRHSHGVPVPDAAMGMVDLISGETRFQGQPWASLSARATAQQRGKIGRFFGEQGWVHHLDIDENITLRQRHHTRRPLVDIESEANQLAQSMGLTGGLPQVRPDRVEARDLQRAACVRMLLGSPLLLIIDEPAAGLYSDVLSALMEQVEKARVRGAAVLWLSADPFVWADDSLRPTRRINLAELRSGTAVAAAV
jgi:phospholipid/cholesterol/gamma-HCH transport system ATP-binding protein